MRNMLNLTASPDLDFRAMSSFQSTWACSPGTVSNLICAAAARPSLCFLQNTFSMVGPPS